MPSKRKPFNDRAGYIASLRSGLNRGWVVIYEAEPAGIDAEGRYVTSCETHGEMVSSSSLPRARAAMKTPADWCHGCNLTPRS